MHIHNSTDVAFPRGLEDSQIQVLFATFILCHMINTQSDNDDCYVESNASSSRQKKIPSEFDVFIQKAQAGEAQRTKNNFRIDCRHTINHKSIRQQLLQYNRFVSVSLNCVKISMQIGSAGGWHGMGREDWQAGIRHSHFTINNHNHFTFHFLYFSFPFVMLMTMIMMGMMITILIQIN